MKDKLLIILVSQDFDQANHRGLWIELSKKIDVLIANIPADYVTSTLTKKTDRIKDARHGVKKITEYLKVFRPLFTLRPEVAPDVLFPQIAKDFWRQVEKIYPDLTSYEINILVYDGRWIRILKGTKDNMRFAYYLFDEVRNNGRDGSVDKNRTKYDDYACKNADFILTMTEMLAQHRNEYNVRKIVIGNGADIPPKIGATSIKIPNSVAFIGNVRDWIDKELISELIQINPGLLFCFVGPIENNMKPFMESLLNNNSNTAYFGQVSKGRIADVYRMFNVVIIPYHDNCFIRATRPIKIVESIMAGTPVVTVPVDGYQETGFLRFARDAASFSREIQYILTHDTIADNYTEYEQFIKENTWTRKAEIILDEFEKSRR